jgi:hydroxyacylglutathione hydrolase
VRGLDVALRLDENTVVLRQHISVNYEAPFIYLLFGSRRALLLDTGATSDAAKFGLRSAVDDLIDTWLAANPSPDYELVVAHSHAHGDHVAADAQFVDRPRTTIVGHDAKSVATFFGVDSWPSGRGALDLGGRMLAVLPIPGHHPSSIAVYDPTTRVLLSGDTIYPGRLYVGDFSAFLASLDRLCEFAAAHPISQVMGAHVEMSTRPGRDFPLGSKRHPREARLPMSVAQLHEIRDAAVAIADSPGAHQFPDFAIWNGPSRGAVARQALRRFLRR